MDAISTLLSGIGAVVTVGGGLSFIVYKVFQHLGVRWLDARFDERLQALKHDHDRELEKLRFSIAALLDRATKLHQREFDVLPEAWAKLNDAFWNGRGLVSGLQSYPDLNRMSAPHQEEVLTKSQLAGWQKDEVRAAADKTKAYQERILWHKINAARELSRAASTYLMKNGIFIEASLRAKLATVNDLVWDAVVEYQVNEEHNVIPRDRRKSSKLSDDGESLMKELESAIHARLWPPTEVTANSAPKG